MFVICALCRLCENNSSIRVSLNETIAVDSENLKYAAYQILNLPISSISVYMYRKPTNVKHRPPSKPKFDSESDSESLPDVLRESKSGSVSEEEEKENKSVMSSTDGGKFHVP